MKIDTNAYQTILKRFGTRQIGESSRPSAFIESPARAGVNAALQDVSRNGSLTEDAGDYSYFVMSEIRMSISIDYLYALDGT